ncbi:MAG: ADP-ribosylglycohydrolase family protein [Rhodobacteraceae bacterium]|nr:ADP-ribosylglycohydrolase family protein [Paracoccaceae bacterium]
MTETCLDTVTLGTPIERLGVSFFPLFMPGNELPEITTGEDSGLKIEELDEESVETLHASNPTDKLVLVVEGEHFLGGLQNRTVNATVLVDSLSAVEIPVSCLERGRWGNRQKWRRSESFTPNRIRTAKRRGVAQSMRYGSRAGDQGRVWEEIDEMLASENVHSRTSAAADLDMEFSRDKSRAETVEELVKRGPLPDQCGVLVAQGSEISAMDLFGAPHLLAAHWGQIVRSHYVESARPSGQPAPDRALELIRRFGRASAREIEGVGLGIERHVDDDDLIGQMLTLNGTLVHSAFSQKSHEEENPLDPGNGRHRPGRQSFRDSHMRRNAPLTDLDRARGLMAGIAVGNLLGIVVEGWPRRAIAQRFPEGMTEIVARPGYPDDDDLAQAIVIADAATAAGGLNVDDLGRRFWVWAETNGLGMGRLTGNVLALYGGSYPRRLARRGRDGTARMPQGMPIVEASQQAWNGRQAGNGALMRCAPLAIRWRDNPNSLVRESVLSAVPTHWDWRCGWSCALGNLAVAAALRGETLSAEDLLRLAREGMAASLPELRDYGYRADIPSSVLNAVTLASRSSIDDLRFDGRNMGFTLLSLQAALISCWQANDFESGLRKAVEAGGDTDTNGAIVGAVLGARFGLAAIPERWLRRVNELRAGRVSMEATADRLAALAEVS